MLQINDDNIGFWALLVVQYQSLWMVVLGFLISSLFFYFFFVQSGVGAPAIHGAGYSGVLFSSLLDYMDLYLIYLNSFWSTTANSLHSIENIVSHFAQ